MKVQEVYGGAVVRLSAVDLGELAKICEAASESSYYATAGREQEQALCETFGASFRGLEIACRAALAIVGGPCVWAEFVCSTDVDATIDAGA